VFGSHFLVPRLAAFRRASPAVLLDVVGETRAANLFRREADLSVRLSRPQEPGLAARRLGTMRFALYGTPEWVARRCEQWEFIGYNETLADAPQQQWLVQFAQNRPFALLANDLVSIHPACQAGMGVALLPRFIVNGTIRCRRSLLTRRATSSGKSGSRFIQTCGPRRACRRWPMHWLEPCAMRMERCDARGHA
jgi:DNA-binding transcriptional LysR family regulator